MEGTSKSDYGLQESLQGGKKDRFDFEVVEVLTHCGPYRRVKTRDITEVTTQNLLNSTRVLIKLESNNLITEIMAYELILLIVVL